MRSRGATHKIASPASSVTLCGRDYSRHLPIKGRQDDERVTCRQCLDKLGILRPRNVTPA